MEKYISREPNRRDCWKGHDSKKNVRSAIRFARSHGRTLRIFERADAVAELISVGYDEIPAAEWDTHFAEEA